MSSILDNFRDFHYFPQHLKRNIKLFHVFNRNMGYCVTNDDKVYGFGENIRKYLGYNESNDNKNYVLIKELCDKQIEVFFGYRFYTFFARSETNEIYSWGHNRYGQLCRGFECDNRLKPEKSDF